jgi:mono/diheme cytochrome c family protein
LLVERHDVSVVPSLRRMARQSPTRVARLHALWTLEGLDAVDWNTAATALADADVDVAVAGARLAERFFAEDPDRAARAIASRLEAGEPAFLRQAALSLGAGPAKSVDDVLTRLATRHGELPFMADALVSSWAGREPAALDAVAGGAPAARAVVSSLTAAILQTGDAAHIDALFARLAPGRSPPALIDGILDGVDRFIPGEGERRRTAFLPREPAGFVALARGDTAQARRAREQSRFLRWRGQPVDEATALASLSVAERERYARGRDVFKVCAACHQPEGQGSPGLAPALVGSPWANGNPGVAIRIVLQGKTDGQATMPPLGTLSDDDIAAVLTYVRRSWGHEASPVTGAQVQAVRSETVLREEPWSESELATLD